MKICLPIALLLLVVSLPSCIVQAPKFAMVEEVLLIKPGMTQQEVSELLEIPPYNIEKMDSAGNYTLTYKYRLSERNVIPLFMKKHNGIKAKGKYVTLIIHYTSKGEVHSFETCQDCDKVEIKERKLNVNTLMSVITITLPALLVYLGLR